jgi:hypothetical protein
MKLSDKFPVYSEYDPLIEVRCVTPHTGRTIHRFFGTSPISPSGTVNNFAHISLGARQAGRIDCRSFKAVVVPVGLVGNAERFPSNPQAHPMLIASPVIS